MFSMMNYIYFILIGTINPIYSIQIHWLDSLSYQITRNPQIHQLVIFLNSNESQSSYQQRIILRKLMELPNLMIDVTKASFLTDFKELKRMNLVNRYIAIYEELHNSVSTDKLNGFLNLFVNITRKYPRPKCLFIVLSHRFSYSQIKDFLIYAWRHKFLDVSLLELRGNLRTKYVVPVYHTYNPFFTNFTRVNFDSNVELFPDKLSDVNQQVLQVPIFNLEPYVKVILNNKTGKSSIKGAFVDLLPIVTKHLNFHVNHTGGLLNMSLWSATDINILNNFNLSVMPTPLPRSEAIYKNDSYVQLDLGYVYEDLVILVPILPIAAGTVSLKIFTNILIIPFITGLCIKLVRLCKLNIERISMFEVLEVLLSLAARYQPTSTAGRFIFFSVIIVGMQYSLEFYTDLMENLVNDDVPFDSLEEIIDYPLTPYVNKALLNVTLGGNDSVTDLLQSRVIPIDSILNCTELLSTNKELACITPKLNAKMRSSIYQDADGSPVMKIAKPILFSQRWVYIFENSSPYMLKFQKLFNRLYQTGVFYYVIHQHVYYHAVSVMENEEEDTKGALFMQLIFILVIGCFFSTIVFLLELVVAFLVRYCWRGGLHLSRRIIKRKV